MTMEQWGALLASGSKTKQTRPPILLVHADKSLGKTTFGAQFPKPAFLCGEDGAHAIADFRWPSDGVIESWGQLLDYTRAFAYGNHDFKTLVADTAGPLSVICLAHTVLQSGKGSWEKMGWGKEEDLVREWRVWLSLLEVCRNRRGMNVVLLAHTTQRKVSNTQLGDAHYVYQGDLHNALWQFTFGWSDVCLFGAYGVRYEEQEHGKGRAVHEKDGTGNKVRWFYSQSDTGFEAKVRSGYWLPAKFKLDYQTYYSELNETPSAVRARILALIPTLTAENTAPHPLDLVQKNVERFVKECGDSVGRLRDLEAQVKKMKEPKEPPK